METRPIAQESTGLERTSVLQDLFWREMRMTLAQLLQHRKTVEMKLRRHGVDGDDAFYLLAFLYVTESPSPLQSPERIEQKGQAALHRLDTDPEMVADLRGLVRADPLGEHLPVWYQHFVGRRFREASGKFFTPRPVANAMARLAPLKPGSVIMDPTCGGGTFLVEASKVLASSPCTLVANDVEPTLIDLTRVVLGLGTPTHHEKHYADSNIYEPSAELRSWESAVDVILANPPFSIPVDHVRLESPLFTLGYRNSDALFLDVCFALLKTGGRLICLVPHSIVANGEFARFRIAVEDRWDLLGTIGMPEGVFHLTANTSTRADIILLQKKAAPLFSPLFFAFAPSVGVALNGRGREGQPGNRLSEIAGNNEVMGVLGVNG